MVELQSCKHWQSRSCLDDGGEREHEHEEWTWPIGSVVVVVDDDHAAGAAGGGGGGADRPRLASKRRRPFEHWTPCRWPCRCDDGGNCDGCDGHASAQPVLASTNGH